MLLIDTAEVPAQERLDYWSESAHAAYLPVQIRSPERTGFAARMWGWERVAGVVTRRGAGWRERRGRLRGPGGRR